MELCTKAKETLRHLVVGDVPDLTVRGSHRGVKGVAA